MTEPTSSPSESTTESSGDEPTAPGKIKILSSLGPAIITASVVLGPGSILSASYVGFKFGFSLTWVLLLATLLMIGLTGLSARLGVVLEGSLCDEITGRAGRFYAALTGISIFFVAACFQFSNNLGIVAAFEPLLTKESNWLAPTVIIGMNVFIIAVIYGTKSLYQTLELMMKILIGMMTLAFAINLLMVHPDIAAILKGFIPSKPDGFQFFPTFKPAVIENNEIVQKASLIDPYYRVISMFATTASVAAAFYQSYLVRAKGWKLQNTKQGLVDSTLGIMILGLITLMVLSTAATVLHGEEKIKLETVADVATQLEPAFGASAKILFCVGIFAGAFSSFLVNAMIGGAMLSDGVGLGNHIDGKWPKALTVLTLLTGMGFSLLIINRGGAPVSLIIFAQSMTLLAFPALIIGMLWLAYQKDLTGERAIPGWMKGAGWVSLVVSMALAVRTAVTVYYKIMIAFGS